MRVWMIPVLFTILATAFMVYQRHGRPYLVYPHSFVYVQDGKVHNLSKALLDKPGALWDNGGMLVYQEK